MSGSLLNSLRSSSSSSRISSAWWRGWRGEEEVCLLPLLLSRVNTILRLLSCAKSNPLNSHRTLPNLSRHMGKDQEGRGQSSLGPAWTGLNSRQAMTTLISSRPNLRQGRSPILEAFFLLRLFSYQRALHSFTRALAAVSRSSCCSTKPQTSAELITSQQPSEPITMNRSDSYSSRFWISGQEMSPMRLAYRSPRERVMAMPGPSSSAQTLGGPTCCPSWVSRQILPPDFQMRSLSSGRMGLWSQESSMASFSLGVDLKSTALESPRLAMQHLLPWMKTEMAQVPELEQSIPLLFSFFSAFLNTFDRQLSTSFSDYSLARSPLCELFYSSDEMQSLAVWLASLPEDPCPSQTAKKQVSLPRFSSMQQVSWHYCFLGPEPMRLETRMVTLLSAQISLSTRSDLLFFFFFFQLLPAPKMLRKFMIIQI